MAEKRCLHFFWPFESYAFLSLAHRTWPPSLVWVPFHYFLSLLALPQGIGYRIKELKPASHHGLCFPYQ